MQLAVGSVGIDFLVVLDHRLGLDEGLQHLRLDMWYFTISQPASLLGPHQVVDGNRVVQLPVLHLDAELVEVLILGVVNEQVVIWQTITQALFYRHAEENQLVEPQIPLETLRPHVGVHEFGPTPRVGDDVSLLNPVVLVKIDKNMTQLADLGMERRIIVPVKKDLN